MKKATPVFQKKLFFPLFSEKEKADPAEKAGSAEMSRNGNQRMTTMV